MYQMWVFIVLFLQCVLGQQIMRDGDLIVLYKLCMNLKTGWIVKAPAQPLCNVTIHLHKSPTYKSQNNSLLSGKSVIASHSNLTCGVQITKTRYLACSPGNTTAPIRFRIMLKHGKDGEPITDRSLIKIRPVDSSIDCNGSPLQCAKKSNDPNAYGFVIVKA